MHPISRTRSLLRALPLSCMLFFASALPGGSPLARAATPVAFDDQLFVASDGAVTIDLTANDVDLDGDPLAAVIVTSPTNGTLSSPVGGTITYTPNPGFAGIDTFSYAADDGSATDLATVTVSVNATFDAELARDTILAGVTTLANPVQPGHMVLYGPTARAIANYDGQGLGDPMIGAATLGAGRVIALPDHQWLNVTSYGSDPSTAQFYRNGLAWLADSGSLDIAIVTLDAAVASWLSGQGYTNVVNANTATLAGALASADVLFAAWLGSNVSPGVLSTIEGFVVGGGGLFIADYGIGYDWWWGQETADIASNRLLRGAGVAFTKTGWHGGGAQVADRAVGSYGVEELLALVVDWTTASNAEKTLGAAMLVKVDEALGAGDILQATLDTAALASAGTLAPSPANPVSDPFAKALLVWESGYWRAKPVAEVTAHPTAFPVGAAAPRITTSRTIDVPDGHATIHIPTGLYAAPGEIVTVGLPPGFQSLGLRARIGHLRTDLGDTNYFHLPFQQVHFDLDAPSVAIASPFGGLISIEASAGEDGLSGVTFTFGNVVEAPTFVLGTTNDADWNGGIRDRATPFGVLIADTVILVVESEAHLRTLERPTELMQIWHDMIAHIRTFYSETTYRPLRVHHDYQPAGGVSTFPQSYGPTAPLVDFDGLVNFGYPLTHHEYGHIVDPSQMIFQNFSEATPNFGGIYASRFFGPWTYRPKGSRERIERYENIATLDLWSLAPHTRHHEKITPFITIADTFGWDALIDTIAALRLTSPANDAEKVDNWLIELGNTTGHDVSPFFALWQLEPSPSALMAVASLPAWSAIENVEERLVLARDTSIVLPSPEANDFSYDGGKTLVATTLPSFGTLTALPGGDFRYLPDPGFTGDDSFDYTVANTTGNLFTATVEITVLDPADSPKLHVGTATADSSTWTVVSLPHAYTAPVVVAQPVRSGVLPSIVPRVRNVTGTSFELRIQRTDGSAAPTGAVTVHWVVAEEGVYDRATHGVKMEAVTRLADTTDRTGALTGSTAPPEWNTYDHYATPVVLGQVMTENDPDWSVWWSNATSRAITAGKHVGSDADTTRADETVGALVIESGTLQFGDTVMRIGDTTNEALGNVNASTTTYAFPQDAPITAALFQATGFESSDVGAWTSLVENGFTGNTVRAILRTDGGGSLPSRRAGFIIASRIAQDCDGDGIPDPDAIQAGLALDCDGNGIPDGCDLASGPLVDCDGNGIPDLCDIAAGTHPDLDGDGVPDACALLFSRGDANADGTTDIADAIAMLGFLFSGTPASCALALDSNDDDGIDISDPIHLLAYLFQAGAPAPAEPFPGCGVDPTISTLSCDAFSPCGTP